MPTPLSSSLMPVSNNIHIKPNDCLGNVAIYVHWPFCLKKCPYCDFNSHVRDTIDHDIWLKCYLDELNWFKARFPNVSAGSIFLGGGTPSLMPAATVGAIIEHIDRLWPHDDPIEITLEANPSSVEAGRFKDYRSAGVNRVSLGIQSLKDSDLQFLGRLHSAKEALDALSIAKNTFDRVSFDLIYALPKQSLDMWQKELEQALTFAGDHLSLYQLTIEEGTAFHHQFHRGKFTLPDEELAAAMYALTQEITASAGLPAYEVSNHARPGSMSRHNLYYWQSLPFFGIGPGAHGRLPGSEAHTAIAHAQVKRPETWIKSVGATGSGMESFEDISAHERAIEALMMGLRLNAGINRDQFKQTIGRDVTHYLNIERLDDLQRDGFIALDDKKLRLTQKGMPVLNTLIAQLVV